MATKKLKHRYVQTFGIIVMVLALVRCVFPGVAGQSDKQQPISQADTIVNSGDTSVVTAAITTEKDTSTEAATKVSTEAATELVAETPTETLTETTTETPKMTDTETIAERPIMVTTAPRYLAEGERPHPIYSVHSYHEAFPDSNHVQLEAARRWGVSPVKNRDDAEKRKNAVVYMGCSPYYDMAHLDASIPYLVPRASMLLQDIGRTFMDSLQVKGLPLHRIVVTSVLRTEEDVTRLRRSNHNATEQSCHLYGTTFDINYNLYNAVGSKSAPDDKLKFVLSEVLDDLRQQGRCYIKYEVRQPCFHITVR